MNTSWVIHTGRLILRPVGYGDLAELTRLKADPLVFAIMLGGVRSAAETARELAEDIAFWGANGFGIWAIREAATDAFLGMTGLHLRPDGRGVALRFALCSAAQGKGYASEAAAAALRFGHERAGLPRILAVARESNFMSRMVLGGIGMVVSESLIRAGDSVLIYESCRAPYPNAQQSRTP
jgi:RimJ/RimL family protein N-acetyltransferase